MRRLDLVLLAGGVLGLTAEWVGFGWGDLRHWIPDLAVGWSFIGSGLIASRRRPESRTGPLMAATGFAWFLGNFAQVGVPAVAWAAGHMVYLHRGPLVQLVLTYPSGRPGSRLVRGAVAVGYAAALITPIWRNTGATILLAGLLVAVCARDYVRAVGPFRRARLPAVYWRVCWWPHGSGRWSPTWSSSSARPARARFAVSCPGRSETRRLRSATGCLTERCSSIPRAACSPCPMPVRDARGPWWSARASRSPCWSTTRPCWRTRGCWRRSPPPPGSPPPTLGSRPRCRPGSWSLQRRVDGSWRHGMRSVAGWSVACTMGPRLGSRSWRRPCAAADDRPPVSERGISSPTPRTSSPERWRSCAGWPRGCIRGCWPSMGWRAR